MYKQQTERERERERERPSKDIPNLEWIHKKANKMEGKQN